MVLRAASAAVIPPVKPTTLVDAEADADAEAEADGLALAVMLDDGVGDGAADAALEEEAASAGGFPAAPIA